MRRWLFFLLLLAIVGSIGWLVLSGINPGYVLIYVGGYSFETTVVALVVAIVVLVLVVNSVLWLLRVLNPLRLRHTWLFRRFFAPHDPLDASQQGLQELLLGNWQLAYKTLVENAEQVNAPLVNYLAASVAAFQRNDRAGWTFCLDRAEKKAGANIHGVRSLRALLETRSGDPRQALAVLQGLQRLVPNQPFVLQLLQENYRSLKDWDSLEQILPDIERRHVLSAPDLLALQDEVYRHQLQRAGDEGIDSLQLCWKQMPKPLRAHAHINAVYIQQLLKLGQETEASTILMNFLKKQWSDEIVALLGHMNAGKPQQQLTLLENCLKQHQDNPTLLLTLGRVSLRNQLWRKAREYFEKALPLSRSTQQSAQINAELARLLERMGEHDKSLRCYQKAVQLLEQG